ncbi:MAG: winged helix-turn-helix domain-containing protein [Phycisphaerales bacterium]|nr:winged helix-turn-helix domain-containing protein [Phycisphaerales bacterium]
MNMNPAVKTAARATQPPSLDKLLTLLGGTVRLALIRELLMERKSVSSLADAVGQSIGLVSHNLKLLRDQGFVVSTPAARHRYYSLSPRILVEHRPDGTKLGFPSSNGENVSILLQSGGQAAGTSSQGVHVQEATIEKFKNQARNGQLQQEG